ncbi:hypothetical protein F5883DRAFT_125928 [Diaporthe sp. PMI_573]|nr:hypothetical protein F5883DRAFT_125928 [Diaporthaceae sp. PMI_573]
MTRPFPFPPPDLPTNKVNGFVLCRNAACEPCAVAPESVPVHSQCFKTLIAIRKTHDTQISLPQLLDYVWTRACYRRPWFRASDLGLASCSQFRWSWLAEISDNSDLAGLQSIPEDLLDIIKQYSPHAYLWRFASILALKPRPISWQLPQTLALQSIEGWQRGDQEVAGISDGSPLIQITVDSQGVQAIKRLPHLPKVNLEGSKQYAYIVEDFSNLAGVQACIRVRYFCCYGKGLSELVRHTVFRHPHSVSKLAIILYHRGVTWREPKQSSAGFAILMSVPIQYSTHTHTHTIY